MPYIHKDYSRFDRDFSIKDQELITEESLNRSPRKLKKLINDVYNRLSLISNRLCLKWVDVEFYEQGELVSYGGKNYEAVLESQNKEPSTNPDKWKIVDLNDYSDFRLDRYLAKDNQTPYKTEQKQNYEKSTDYHPATKIYVDAAIDYAFTNRKAYDSDRLDGHDSSFYATKENIDNLSNNVVHKTDIIDNLTTQDNLKTLSANQGYVLKQMIDTINSILSSNDISLDHIQEIVDFIKRNRKLLESLGIDNILGLREELNQLKSLTGDAVPKTWWNSDLFRKRITEIDGANSGIDADLLDGLNSSDFVLKTEFTNRKLRDLLAENQGAGSGIDADKLDGLHSSSFIRRDSSDTPTAHNSFDLGSTSLAWRNIYSVNFTGTALQAKFADLAEKYKTKEVYEPGTILGLENGLGVKFQPELKLLGVVSENPALKINSDIDGTYIALKGLVKVKVKGSYRKDQYVLADSDGYGIAVDDYNFEESKRLVGVIIDIKDDICLVKV